MDVLFFYLSFFIIFFIFLTIQKKSVDRKFEKLKSKLRDEIILDIQNIEARDLFGNCKINLFLTRQSIYIHKTGSFFLSRNSPGILVLSNVSSSKSICRLEKININSYDESFFISYTYMQKFNLREIRIFNLSDQQKEQIDSVINTKDKSNISIYYV